MKRTTMVIAIVNKSKQPKNPWRTKEEPRENQGRTKGTNTQYQPVEPVESMEFWGSTRCPSDGVVLSLTTAALQLWMAVTAWQWNLLSSFGCAVHPSWSQKSPGSNSFPKYLEWLVDQLIFGDGLPPTRYGISSGWSIDIMWDTWWQLSHSWW